MGALRDSKARIPFAVLSAAGLGLTVPAIADAATFTVTNLNDDGPGSLRNAIDTANTTAASDRVVFQSGLSGNIDLTSGPLYSYRPIEIDGPGDDQIRVRGGGGGVIVFETNPGDDVSVDGLGFRAGFGALGGNVVSIDADLTLTDVSTRNGSGLLGGGLAVIGSEVTIRDSTISGNYAYAVGGGAYICSDGKVTIENTEITGNEATYAGGAAICAAGGTDISNSVVSGNQAASGAGGLYLGSDTGSTITDSRISGNDAGEDCYCGGYGGGILTARSDLTLTGSTVSGNTAVDGGGIAAVYESRLFLRSSTVSGNDAINSGGGLYALESALAVRNSTIADNTAEAGWGGGVSVRKYATPRGGPASFQATTITGNSAGAPGGGGIFNYDAGTVGLDSSIVADNSGAPMQAPNIGGDFAGSFNVIGDTTGGSISGPNNVLDVANPRLGPLADNGGPTETVLPAQDSPAIDAGDPALDGSRDQRGIVRADTDAGAVEAAVCEGVPVNRIGTDGDDVLEGTDGPDGILGFAGDDAITALNSADGVCAGQGDDAVNAGNGADAVLGNRGDDAIEGKNGPDGLNGGGGEDAVAGGAATDEIQGGNGDDDLGGGAGNGDQVLGGNAGDLLAGGAGTDDLCDGQRGRNRAKPNCDIVRNARPVGGAAAEAADAVEQGLDGTDTDTDSDTDGTQETDEAADALELGEPEAVRPWGAEAE